MEATFLVRLRTWGILLNWSLSFFGLSVDTCHSPMWAVMVMVGWFCGSSLLVIYANKRGWLNGVCKEEED